MRKSTERDILRWHERGYTVAEIHRILPQCTTDEITAIIHNHPTKKRRSPMVESKRTGVRTEGSHEGH